MAACSRRQIANAQAPDCDCKPHLAAQPEMIWSNVRRELRLDRRYREGRSCESIGRFSGRFRSVMWHGRGTNPLGCDFRPRMRLNMRGFPNGASESAAAMKRDGRIAGEIRTVGEGKPSFGTSPKPFAERTATLACPQSSAANSDSAWGCALLRRMSPAEANGSIRGWGGAGWNHFGVGSNPIPFALPGSPVSGSYNGGEPPRGLPGCHCSKPAG